MFYVAIGDTHGHLAQLKILLSQVRSMMGSDPYRLIFLGDYIDRGPDSYGVVKLVQEMQKEGHLALMGNHERMMIDAYTSFEWDRCWQSNGGDVALESFPDRVENLKEIREWAETLPLSAEDDEHFYVHAGIDPTLKLADQYEKDMLWIRERFLFYPDPMEKYVVHGHTPVQAYIKAETPKPDVRENRCNLDVGSFISGNLAAAAFDPKIKKPVKTLVV